MNSRRVELKENIPKLGYSILLYNVEKEGNIGTIIRTAHAFGCDEILVFGREKLSNYILKCSRGMHRWIDIQLFHDHGSLFQYIEKMKYSVVVIDTFPKAKPLTNFEFPKKPLFVFGNEKSGIDEEMMEFDQVYIPQIGTQISINVAGAASIVLYKIFKERWTDYSRIDDWNCSYSINEGIVKRK